MNEENSSENQPVKKKSFLSIGKLFWFFIFLLAVAVAALLINVWLELQRPQPPQSQPVQQQNTVAVGVIIGGAFGKNVTSLVNDVLMPLLSILTGGINFSDLKIVVKADLVIYNGANMESFISVIEDTVTATCFKP